jgi:hypothetical protein
MESSKLFPARLSHPRLTPPVITDPLNLLIINVLIKIEPDRLVFNTEPLLNRGKIFGEERFSNIANIKVEYLKASKRREEIFRKSLIRGILWVIIFFFIILFTRPYGIDFLILIPTIAGIVGGIFYFLFNGGITTWDDKVRFTCVLEKENKKFFFEVDPKLAAEVYRTLINNGIRIDIPDRNN